MTDNDKWSTAEPPDTDRLVLVAVRTESRPLFARCHVLDDPDGREWHLEFDRMAGHLRMEQVLGWQELPELRKEWLVP